MPILARRPQVMRQSNHNPVGNAINPIEDHANATIIQNMPTRKFHKAVLVQPGRIDRDLVVVSAHMAAEVLLRRWPNRECPYRVKAMRECLDVIQGRKPPSRARTAFIRAAKEARILLKEEFLE